MKSTAEDFQDKLAGKQSKHIACGIIRYDIEEGGLSCKIHRRKLARGRKIYFIIGNEDPDYETVEDLRDLTINIVRNFFPDANLTSGGPTGWTIAEF